MRRPAVSGAYLPRGATLGAVVEITDAQKDMARTAAQGAAAGAATAACAQVLGPGAPACAPLGAYAGGLAWDLAGKGIDSGRSFLDKLSSVSASDILNVALDVTGLDDALDALGIGGGSSGPSNCVGQHCNIPPPGAVADQLRAQGVPQSAIDEAYYASFEVIDDLAKEVPDIIRKEFRDSFENPVPGLAAITMHGLIHSQLLLAITADHAYQEALAQDTLLRKAVTRLDDVSPPQPKAASSSSSGTLLALAALAGGGYLAYRLTR